MRANLSAIQEVKKVKSVAIGTLTAIQLADINAQRIEEELSPIVAEILFVGGHVYKSRVLKDGYAIEDIIDAESALSEQSIVIVTAYMTAMQDPIPRADRLGNHVNDRAISNARGTDQPRAIFNATQG